LEKSENDFFASQYRKYKDDLTEADHQKEVAVKEAYERGVTDGRAEIKIVSSFLKYASYLRGTRSEIEGENQAAEDVLIGVYQGGEKGATVAQKLAEGVNEPVAVGGTFTCTSLCLR
jgi:hypothetical protein